MITKSLFYVCSLLTLSASLVADINTTFLLNRKQASEDIQEGVILPIAKNDLRDWKLGYHLVTQSGSIFEWIPKTEEIENWSELIQIQSFVLTKYVSAETFVANFVNALKENVPEAIVRIIQKNNDSVLLDWNLAQPSKDQVPQSEIARIISTKKGVYRIAYTKKTPTMDPQLRDAWIKRLNGIKIVPRQQPQGIMVPQPPLTPTGALPQRQ